MRLIKISLIAIVVSVSFYSCQKEYFEAAKFDPNTPVSFSKDLQPILTSSCTQSGCHDKSVSPNLLEGKAYSSLIDGGFVDTLNPDASILMIKLNTNMPPEKLPTAEINKFLSWMKQGAQDN